MSDAQPSRHPWLEVIAKAGAFLGIYSYVSGALIVNLHLASLGFSPLGFFENQYLLAGLWSLVPLLAGAAVTSIGQQLLQAFGRGHDPRKARSLAALLGVSVAVNVMVVLAGLYIVGVRLTWEWLALTLAGITVAFISFVALWKPTNESEFSFRGILISSAMLVMIFSVLVYPATFNNLVYDDIPQSLGGGELVPARLLLTDEGRDVLGRTGYIAGNSSSVNVSLVLQSQEDVLVLMPEGQPIVMGRRLVAAIVLPE